MGRNDPAANAISVASLAAVSMKRERFVDMEAFSRSIMPCWCGDLAIVSTRPHHAGMSINAFDRKAPDRVIKGRYDGDNCQFLTDKNRAAPGRNRGFGGLLDFEKAMAAPVRKTNSGVHAYY